MDHAHMMLQVAEREMNSGWRRLLGFRGRLALDDAAGTE